MQEEGGGALYKGPWNRGQPCAVSMSGSYSIGLCSNSDGVEGVTSSYLHREPSKAGSLHSRTAGRWIGHLSGI